MRCRPLTLAAAALVLAAACGGTGAAGSGERLTVFAAASLTEPFTELAEEFERQHPGLDVVTSFDSSGTIATQVIDGAPADVVATADPVTMRRMAEAGALAGEPVTFAHNRMVLVVPAGDPAGIDALGDLDGADYVVCAASAPCGVLAEQVLERGGVTTPPRSREVDVKAVLTKVELDEADAGMVYASDAVAAGDRVEVVDVPEVEGATTSYPVAVAADSAAPGTAQEFVDLVLSGEGQRVLVEAGFTGEDER